MLQTGNILGRITTSKILEYVKKFVPIVTRSFHVIPTTALSIATASPTIVALGTPTSRFLAPANPIYSQVAGFKVKGRLRRRCNDCYFVMRQQRLYVICKTHPRHKQMSMMARDYKSWILTHATQSKIRPY